MKPAMFGLFGNLVSRRQLFVCRTSLGETFLWAAKLPRGDRRSGGDLYNVTALKAAEQAKTRWTRMASDEVAVLPDLPPRTGRPVSTPSRTGPTPPAPRTLTPGIRGRIRDRGARTTPKPGASVARSSNNAKQTAVRPDGVL